LQEQPVMLPHIFQKGKNRPCSCEPKRKDRTEQATICLEARRRVAVQPATTGSHLVLIRRHSALRLTGSGHIHAPACGACCYAQSAHHRFAAVTEKSTHRRIMSQCKNMRGRTTWPCFASACTSALCCCNNRDTTETQHQN
jgi:hypothetical protein